jgi:hypothetical protein
MAPAAKNILTSFLRRLTNLSGNNRGLVLLRLSGDQFMDLHQLSHLAGQKSFEIIRALVKGQEARVCPILDSRMEAANIASDKLKMLRRADRFVFEERGANDLHVGWPFVRGKFADGTLVRCPLLYFPVQLVQQGQFWLIQPRADAGITFNKSFILAYAFYHNLKVEEELLDFSFDDLDREITPFLTQIYELLINKIELNFNRDNFLEELQPFVQFKRAEFEEQHGAGELKLFPEAALGIFPEAGSQLVPDYLHLIENETIDDLEGFFERETDGPAAEQNTRPAHNGSAIKEEKLFTPFALDAWQENAIREIKLGQSIVVQGPPGTGKSQLICNLLADAIASGRKVLLVCQKRAALDVVYDRMKARELAPFLGLVHDYRNDRRELFEKIDGQISKIDEYKTRNRAVDVIQMERRFLQVCRTIDQLSEELQEFRDALFSDAECGVPVKNLYLTSYPGQPSLNLKQEYHHFRFPLDDFLKKLRRYSQYASLFEGGHPWRERKSFSDLNASDQQLLEHVIGEIIHYQNTLAASVFRITGTNLNLDEIESLWYRHEEILGMLSLLKEESTYTYFQRMCRESEDETSLLWLSNMERMVMNCFEDLGPEVTIPTDRLGKFQEALNERMKTRGNLIRKIRWEFFSENKFVVKRALVANELAYNKYGLKVLEQRIDSRLNIEHHLTALKNKSWLLDLPAGYDKPTLQKWFNFQKLAIRAKTIFRSLREIKDGVNPEVMPKQEFHKEMRALMDIIRDVPAKKEEWLRYLSHYHIRQLILDPDAAPVLTSSLKKDFDNMCEFDRLKESLSTVEENLILKVHDHVGKWEGEVLAKVVENSLALAWIDHIEVKFPVLRAVSSLKMEEMQRELLDLVTEKQKLSLEILLVRARENAYERLTYNRLNNLVTFRDLHHQVTKKKKLWPLRKVIATFSDELFQLIPCWMASPESVSALFPMQTLFDLVIFDEASQCFAERGIPAMYRGKQIVVAGDGQQLRPSDLYQIRWTDDEPETADAEVESLLQLSERYLPTVHLQGHYRSRSYELMEFSNHHFYGRRLRLLPDRRMMNDHEPPIEYRKVQGMWQSQVNKQEAATVVDIVMDLLQQSPVKEIGIVTFNALQQNLIIDELEKAAQQNSISIPASLFVKNIENVQGDEKDIIIFSVGYSPDAKGKMSLQFGSLNVAGGENRLNVAVTRAREKIVVVTSIDPEQLNAASTKNAGPKLLQQYLEYARDVHEGRFRMTPRANGSGAYMQLAPCIADWGRGRLEGFDFELNTLPYSDINVIRQGKYLGVILTDDDRFGASSSVKEAFAYTPMLLEHKNWNYRFVFSRQYWRDMDSLEQSLMLFVGNQSG